MCLTYPYKFLTHNLCKMGTMNQKHNPGKPGNDSGCFRTIQFSLMEGLFTTFLRKLIWCFKFYLLFPSAYELTFCWFHSDKRQTKKKWGGKLTSQFSRTGVSHFPTSEKKKGKERYLHIVYFFLVILGLKSGPFCSLMLDQAMYP